MVAGSVRGLGLSSWHTLRTLHCISLLFFSLLFLLQVILEFCEKGSLERALKLGKFKRKSSDGLAEMVSWLAGWLACRLAGRLAGKVHTTTAVTGSCHACDTQEARD
jgi:hypothetical protein